MKIYQSLYDASLYRTVALIPEQTVFGLALATSGARNSAEAQESLRLGKEFCEVLEAFVAEGKEFRPATSSAATIAAGLQELPESELPKWRGPFSDVRALLNSVLSGTSVDETAVKAASGTLQGFASFAKQRLSLMSDPEHLRLAWH